MALTKLTKNLIDGTFGTEWVSTIQTSNFTAQAAKGYFVNTTSNEITISLPAGVVGNEVIIQDYAGTFATNKVIFSANGSEKIQGVTDDFKCVTNNATVTLIYQDATKGWTADNITTNVPPLLHFLVVAAGGSSPTGGNNGSANGGGGAGGLRTSYGTVSPITISGGSMESPPEVVVGTSYSITVGAGGATNGNNSTFSNITSTGGGHGAINNTSTDGQPGGSGGGASGYNGANSFGSAVSTPVVQGFNGGSTPTANDNSTAGGGAGGAAGSGDGPGGLGLVVNILSANNATTASVGEVSGSDVYYASGGASGSLGTQVPNTSLGGGGDGSSYYSSQGYSEAAANTGGGAGSLSNKAFPVVNGGSGVVILRYPNLYTAAVPGGLSEATGSPFTEGTEKVSVFTAGTGNITFN